MTHWGPEMHVFRLMSCYACLDHRVASWQSLATTVVLLDHSNREVATVSSCVTE